MKDFLFALAAFFILPVVLTSVIIYAISYVMQLLFRIIIIGIEKGMTWVDKNITQNIRWLMGNK